MRRLKLNAAIRADMQGKDTAGKGFRTKAAAWSATGLLLVAGTTGCGTGTTEPAPTSAVPSAAVTEQQQPHTARETGTPAKTTTPSEKETAGAGTALAQLETITIKGRAPKTGYDRDEFGYGWMDPDGNGCDSRIICTL